MTTNKPEVDEHLKNLEIITSEAVAEAYRLRRLWEFSAAMISANEKKIKPRGRDEERLLALAKSADHGMAWAGITYGWIDRRMGITKNRIEHGVRAKPNVLAYHSHGGHLYEPDDVVFEDDEDYEPLIRLKEYEDLQAECEKLRAAMIEAKSYIDHYMYGGSNFREPAAQAIALIDAAMQGCSNDSQ